MRWVPSANSGEEKRNAARESRSIHSWNVEESGMLIRLDTGGVL